MSAPVEFLQPPAADFGDAPSIARRLRAQPSLFIRRLPRSLAGLQERARAGYARDHLSAEVSSNCLAWRTAASACPQPPDAMRQRGNGEARIERRWRCRGRRRASCNFPGCVTKGYPFGVFPQDFCHCPAVATTALNFDPFGCVRAPNLISIMAFLENSTSLPRAITFEYTDHASP